MIYFRLILLLVPVFLIPFIGQGQSDQEQHYYSTTDSTIRSKVEGTFYFHSSTGTMIFLPLSDIESLYYQIDMLRQEDVVVIWPLKENLEIIILPFNQIHDPSFVKMENPYAGPSKINVD